MDTFDRTALQNLIRHKEGPCVSLFLQTNPAGKDGEQDAIRLKNLMRDAEHKLAGHWVSAQEAKVFLGRAANVPSDPTFWEARSRSLAVFMAPDLFQAYRVNIPLVDQAVVASRFRVRPLLPLLEQQLSFFLLTVSENRVALYSVDEQSIEKVEVPGLPASLVESLNYIGADRGSQIHTAMRGVVGKQAAVFHGHGGQRDTSKEDQLSFCAEIDKAVTSWLGDSNRPLLLACVKPLAPIYRQKNSYRHLLSENFTGNHDHDSEHELRTGAWGLVQPLLKSEASLIAGRYSDRSGTDRVSDDPRAIVSAALQGRVEALLYDPKAELFGDCCPAGLEVQITGQVDDEDLVDLAAVETLLHGGMIHSMTGHEIPTNAPLAAIFRY